MVRHIVWWTLKPEAEGRTAAENAKLIKQRLEALMGQIPSLKSLEVSYDFLPTCTMPVNVILMTTHDDAEGLKAYAEHPAHVAVGKELIKLVTESRQAIDYTFSTSPEEGKGPSGEMPCGSFPPSLPSLFSSGHNRPLPSFPTAYRL